MRWTTYALTAALLAGTTASAVAAPAAPCTPAPWKLTRTDTVTLPLGYTRSQGVTWDGTGWIFSWQAGLTRTDDAYTPSAAGTIPPELLANNPTVNPVTRDNDLGGNHIGDIDTYKGLVYAPVEEGGQNAKVIRVNNPDYQRSYIALFDARTLQYTGRKVALPLAVQAAGVPWVAVDQANGEVYTDEWEMPHDRLNVFDKEMAFQRFLPLVYPAALGKDFHLTRVQGAKVLGSTMYATRDDDQQTVFAIDLRTGVVTRLFALDSTVPDTEMEGLAVRPMPDGSLLHTLTIYDAAFNDTSGSQSRARVEFDHWAPPVVCRWR